LDVDPQERYQERNSAFTSWLGDYSVRPDIIIPAAAGATEKHIIRSLYNHSNLENWALLLDFSKLMVLKELFSGVLDLWLFVHYQIQSTNLR
jgi:hypothetical protein